MTDSELIKKAKDFATAKHEGQLDDSGWSFIMHPKQVFDILVCITYDVNLLCAAMLHDTIEDCGVSYDDLKSTFNEDIANLVNEVTHEGDKKRGYYFPRLRTKRGIMLKFADRLSNLSRMEPWDEKRQEHYLQKSRFWKQTKYDK